MLRSWDRPLRKLEPDEAASARALLGLPASGGRGEYLLVWMEADSNALVIGTPRWEKREKTTYRQQNEVPVFAGGAYVLDASATSHRSETIFALANWACWSLVAIGLATAFIAGEM